MSKKIFIFICIIFIIFLVFRNNKKESFKENNNIVKLENIQKNVINQIYNDKENIVSEVKDIPKKEIKIVDVDGKGKNYTFEYNGETFSAIYTKDNWKIIDSYKIKKKEDIIEICQALINIHPIHGMDMVTYRSADDMSYEWLQHNLAYEILPEDNAWRKNAKDVDLDPKDQYKSLKEIYEDRTGKKLF